VRGVLVTVAVACLVACGAAVTGWGLQAAVLPPPTKAARVTARAVSWLLRYRLVDSRFRIGDGPPVRGECLQAWIPAPHHAGEDRGTVLALDTGRTLVVSPEGVRLLGPRRPEPKTLPLVQLDLGGCPRMLAPRLAAILQTKHIHVERAFAAGYPALAIRVQTKRTRLVVYVTPRTFKPFAVAVDSRRYRAHSRIRLTRLTPARLERLMELAGR
jgi:hypothetical protein